MDVYRAVVRSSLPILGCGNNDILLGSHTFDFDPSQAYRTYGGLMTDEQGSGNDLIENNIRLLILFSNSA